MPEQAPNSTSHPARTACRTVHRLFAAGGLLAAAACGAVDLPSGGSEVPPGPPAMFTCTVASITDGDTFRCAEADAGGRQLRVRLSGVAARERDGSCTSGHPCPPASAEAATETLRRLAEGQVLTCRRAGTSYNRIAAFCRRRDGTDLSCAMVDSGTALRWDRFWGDHRCTRTRSP